MAHDPVYTVSGLTALVRQSVEGAFPFVWVRGQVANLARPSSGHVYFTLRDASASLAAVWFRGKHAPGDTFDPMTGEVYADGPRPSLAQTLKDGQEVVCAGRLSVYAPRGVYQLMVELGQDVGQGRLQADFERLKIQLAGMGYFAPERKRPLPAIPRRVAVITAPGGAAIYDFLRVAALRGTGSTIRLYPTLVQGEMAASQIVARLERVYEEGWADVVVLIRGGGSLEDLWAFNNENLATAIKNSPLPVLAGIGHEVDVTLADMTADVRAATPSHAAQLLWREREEYRTALAGTCQRLEAVFSHRLGAFQNRVDSCAHAVAVHSPVRRLALWQDSLSQAEQRLSKGMRFYFKERFGMVASLLRAASRPPASLADKARQVAGAGKALGQAMEGLLQNRTGRLAGAMTGVDVVPHLLARKAALADRATEGLIHAGERAFSALQLHLERASLGLEVFDPQKPLQRGYSLVYKQDGLLLRAANEVRPGALLRITVSDGLVAATVSESLPGRGQGGEIDTTIEDNEDESL